MSITVIEVMRAMRVEPTPGLTWSVGAQVRELYERLYGSPPEKALRTKTSGTGSHCFAVYPRHMHRQIVEIIEAQRTEEQRQGELPL